MKTMAILGCGWLGLPLAAALVARGYDVHGATTSGHKTDELCRFGIQPFVISASADSIQGSIAAFLSGCDILILTIPPGKTDGNYPSTVKRIAEAAKKAGLSEVIFTSSISVYPNEARTFAESDLIQLQVSPSPEILASEQIIRDHFPTALILRLGGLVGGERHPAKFVGQKKAAENPAAPINLVHRDDCVGIILQLIQNDVKGKVFNIVAPYHPSRKEYYTQKALAMGLPAPTFSDEPSEGGKTVSSDHLISHLNYTFLVTTDL